MNIEDIAYFDTPNIRYDRFEGQYYQLGSTQVLKVKINGTWYPVRTIPPEEHGEEFREDPKKSGELYGTDGL